MFNNYCTVYPYYYYTTPSYYYDYLTDLYRGSTFFTYGPRSYYPPYTPYATYRNIYSPTVKRVIW